MCGHVGGGGGGGMRSKHTPHVCACVRVCVWVVVVVVGMRLKHTPHKQVSVKGHWVKIVNT